MQSAYTRSPRPSIGTASAIAGGMVLLLGVATTPAAAARQRPAPVPLVFDGVTVVDVAQGKLVPNQRVVITGTRITAVQTSRGPVPTGARVVAARGKYLIPGLWDMHAHGEQPTDADRLYPHYIASGITGLREMAQRFGGGTDSFYAWQRQIAAGTRVGPRGVGPSFDMCYWEGRQGNNAMPTPEAARRILDSLQTAGTAFVKIHGCTIPRDNFFAIAAAARRVGLSFVGHIPNGVSEIEAVDSGMRSIEHVEMNHSCWAQFPTPLDTLAEQRCARTAAAYRRNHAWWTPTLSLIPCHRNFGNLQDAQQVVGRLHRLGVPILAGTDLGACDEDGQSLPYRIYRELDVLVGAGLTPIEALRTATLNPALFFNATDSLGTIAPGKLADLVLLDADPLADVRNTTEIRAVVANGRYFDSTALAALRGARPYLTARQRPAAEGDTQAVYLGYRRTARFASPEGLRRDTLVTYTAPPPVQLGERTAWGLAGPWRVTSEGATLPTGPGRLVFRFQARRFNLIFGPAPGADSARFRVRIDGQPPGDAARGGVSPEGEGRVRWLWIHQFLSYREGPLRDRTIEVEFLDPVTVYEVTFDPK